MPTIRKRGDFQYQAIVRRAGFPPQSKTFISRKDAEAWAASIESEILGGSFTDRTEANRTSLGDLLVRYSREVSPHKKGGSLEQLRIQKLLDDPIAQVKISALSGVNMSRYRDMLTPLSAEIFTWAIGSSRSFWMRSCSREPPFLWGETSRLYRTRRSPREVRFASVRSVKDPPRISDSMLAAHASASFRLMKVLDWGGNPARRTIA